MLWPNPNPPVLNLTTTCPEQVVMSGAVEGALGGSVPWRRH